MLKKEIIIFCPHCNEPIIIEEINCGIFRHAILKNGQQIDPHSPKIICDDLVKKNLIIGCGKPFKFDGYNLEICDYI